MNQRPFPEGYRAERVKPHDEVPTEWDLFRGQTQLLRRRTVAECLTEAWQLVERLLKRERVGRR